MAYANHKSKWTSQEVELLKKHLNQGKESAEIAMLMGRTKSAIDSKKNHIGICNKEWTHAEDKRLKQLVDEGKTAKEIAKILGNRTDRAVCSRKDVLGIHKPVEYYRLSARNPKHVAEVIKFRMAGWKLQDIAKVFGVDTSDVSRLLRKYGFKGKWWVRRKHRKKRQYWTELEIALLRKYLKRGYSVERIRSELPHRSEAAIRKKRTEITRYWLSPAEKAEREQRKRKQLRVY